MSTKTKIAAIILGVALCGGAIAAIYHLGKSDKNTASTAQTFTHPDYGFSVTAPGGMKTVFNRYHDSNPPYDSIGMYYPGQSCFECSGPPEIRISVWKVAPTKTFAQALATDGYGAYLREKQILDTSKYSTKGDWSLYVGPDLKGDRVNFAYSVKKNILLKFENTKLEPEMQAVINSLTLSVTPATVK